METALYSEAVCLAPIVLFVYNRPWHTMQTIEALKRNEFANESELFIYSDAPKNEQSTEKVTEVREYIKGINGFKKVTIIEREYNWGLASSIIDGVTSILDKYEKVIVLEDDLLTSQYFLIFINEALNIFGDREDICSITGFNFPSETMKFPHNYADDIFLNIRPMSWSWATWKNKWNGVDWEVKDYQSFISDKNEMRRFNRGGSDLTGMLMAQKEGRVDSWYIRWCFHMILNNKLTVYPRISFVNNVGFDSSGRHGHIDKNNILSNNVLNMSPKLYINKHIQLNEKIVSRFNQTFNLTLCHKIKQIIKKILNL